MVPLEGPIGVGALIEAILLGCVFVQSCVYFKNSGRDAWLLKVLVSLILFFLLSHLGCIAAWLWASVQVNTEDASVPGYAAIPLGVSSVLGATVLFLERCFFSHRILKVSNNHLLGFVFFIFCIFSFTAALGTASLFFGNVSADLTSQLNSSWTFPFVVISGLVCDLAINIATAFYLRSQTRAPTEVAGALGHAAWLFFLVAETSSVTSLVDVVALILYFLTMTNFAWLGILVPMPGVFANALLAALNVRGCLHTDIEHQRILNIGNKLIDERPKKPPIMITISKKVEKHSENSPV